jgi:hypothetical protein
LIRTATRAVVPSAAAISAIRATLAWRLGVDGFHAEADGVDELVVCLADAGEDDLVGREPGAQGDVDLAAGVRVCGGAKFAQAADDARGWSWL